MKKAQAAMEFLMTYGWAVLAITVVVGLLFTLGIFDLPVPSTCDIPNPYICRDMKIDSSTDVFTIKLEAVNIDNSRDENRINSITINGKTCTLLSYSSPLKTSADAPVTATCDFKNPGWRTDFSKSSRFEGTIALSYIKYGGSVRAVTGTFSGKTE